MSIESNLNKYGIHIIEPLDKLSINTIAYNVSNKIINAFPNMNFDFDFLYNKFSNLAMYIANIPEGMSEASYFYKNSSIYFRDGMGLSDLEKFAVHELIHNLQEKIDNKGNLLRLGLYKIDNFKNEGLALNEAAVQLLASNILGNTFENVSYYGLNFSTISPNYYPLVCNLIYQMAYITGEDVLFDSTFNSNDLFENKFISICGPKSYYKISNLFDKLLSTEEKIIIINNKILNNDFSNEKLKKLYIKIDKLKIKIKEFYLATQETIIVSYFSSLYNNISNSEDIEKFRKKLYCFNELIGTYDNYTFFNDFYINMMEKLDMKQISFKNNLSKESTYLINSTNNLFLKFINYFKCLFLNKTITNENKK